MTRRSDDRRLLEPFAGLLGEVAGAQRSFEIGPAEIELDGELRLATPIRGTGRATRTNRGLLLELSARTDLDETCSRCLDPLMSPIAIDLEEEVLPSLDLVTGTALDISAEPEVARLDDHHRLDLEPLLRDAISLAEPIAPLCRPDCPGLCAVCGFRLADDPPHRHEDEPIDPRLAVLQGFTVDAGDENR